MGKIEVVPNPDPCENCRKPHSECECIYCSYCHYVVHMDYFGNKACCSCEAEMWES